MADSLFGNIAETIGSTVSDVSPGLNDALKDVGPRFSEILAPMMQGLAESGNHLTAELMPFLQNAPSDVIEAIPDTGADADPSSANVSELNAGTMDAITSKLDTLTNEAQARIASGDAEAQLQGQREMQQIQEMTEAISKVLQQSSEGAKQAIESLHGDADIDDDTLVAVADVAEGEVAGVADADVSDDDLADPSAETPAYGESAPDDVSTTA